MINYKLLKEIFEASEKSGQIYEVETEEYRDCLSVSFEDTGKTFYQIDAYVKGGIYMYVEGELEIIFDDVDQFKNFMEQFK